MILITNITEDKEIIDILWGNFYQHLPYTPYQNRPQNVIKYANYLSYVNRQTSFSTNGAYQRNPGISDKLYETLTEFSHEILKKRYCRLTYESNFDLAFFNSKLPSPDSIVTKEFVDWNELGHEYFPPTVNNNNTNTATSITSTATVTNRFSVSLNMSDSQIPTAEAAKAFFEKSNHIVLPPDTLSHNSNMLGDVLQKLDFTSTTEFLSENSAFWAGFGLMDSNIYRDKFLKLASEAELDPKEIFFTIALASIMKNKTRILNHFDRIPSKDKAPWLTKVKAFVSARMVHFVTQVTDKTFPIVNLPSSFPNVDLFAWAHFCNPVDLRIEVIKNRTTFSQLHLDQIAQLYAKSGYDHFWDNVVKGSNNPSSKEAPKSREEYYKNPASDTYKLIRSDGKEDLATRKAYTLADIQDWINEMKRKRGVA